MAPRDDSFLPPAAAPVLNPTVRFCSAIISPSMDGLTGKRNRKAFKNHPDAFIFKNLPGAGAALAPRLLSVFGEDRERWADASAVQKHSGIAPVIARSGKSNWVHRRFACPRFERQTFHEFAGASIVYSRWARA